MTIAIKPAGPHTYALLTAQDDLDRFLTPVLYANGSEIPAPGNYVAAVELDSDARVVAYQMIQTAVFLEGLWARDGSAHLLRVWHMASEYLTKTLGATAVMTMTGTDAAGQRIGKVAEAQGFQNLNLNVYRRIL